MYTCRSSEEALAVLLKFLEFDTRESIRKQLSTKFDLIMRQFIKEITAIEDKFTVRIRYGILNYYYFDNVFKIRDKRES